MPPDRQAPGSPADWLARAWGDLALSAVALPQGAFYEDLCFHAQQAVEKALKAVYRAARLEFRYTHDIDELASGLASHGIEIPPEVGAAVDLTTFAWEARYPGAGEPVTEDEHRDALAMAEQVVRWASERVQEMGGSTNE